MSAADAIAPGGGTPFWSALVRQLVVIGALTMREIHIRYGRRNIGFLWIMAEPFLFTFGVIVLRSLLPFRAEYSSVTLVGFLLTGYTPFLLFRHMVGQSIHCIVHNGGVLYHRNVKFIDLFMANYLLESAGIVMAFSFGCALFYFAGFLNPPRDLFLLYAGWFYAIWFSAAIAMLFGAMSPLSTLVERLYNPASYLSLPISGAFFMVNWLPPEYRGYALYIPTVHYFEMIRAGYFGSAAKAHYETSYILATCVVLTFFALIMLRYVRRRVAIQ